VVEGSHFRPGTEPGLIGRKAVLRNLSDVAAMAAKPVATLACCVLPPSWSGERAEALFDSVRTTAREWGCPLVGGDIAVHGADAPLVVSVTILATPWPEAIEKAGAGDPVRSVVRRHRAKEGDRIFVTGELGGSVRADGGGRHLRFEPRLQEAKALLDRFGAERLSLVDLSDGLGRDAAHLVDDRHQAVIDAASLPCAPGCDWRAALGDGEDYELCVSAPDERIESLPARNGGSTRVTAVGFVRRRPSTGDPACLVRCADGELDGLRFGWEHRADGR